MARKSAASKSAVKRGPMASGGDYHLRLYVVDMNEKSVLAFQNLKRLCEHWLAGHYRIEVIDLLEQPERARNDQIVAVPTVVRCGPLPLRRVIGSLSDVERTLTGLDLRSAAGTAG